MGQQFLTKMQKSRTMTYYVIISKESTLWQNLPGLNNKFNCPYPRTTPHKLESPTDSITTETRF